MDFGFPELAAIRLGFGLSPHHPPLADADAILASVAAATSDPNAMTTDEARAVAVELGELTQQAKSSEAKADREKVTALRREQTRVAWSDLQRRIARAIDDPGGFGERLVQFWADHFTIRANGAGFQKLGMAFVDEAIRPNLNGRFEEMFFAADTHPMMLVYLNQNSSVGPGSVYGMRRAKQNKVAGLNENLAREAIELHSLGVTADYSQQDVREFAELLTGLTYDSRSGRQFLPKRAEPGAETVLGKSYGGTRHPTIEDIRAAFNDLARHPETAAYLSKKLAIHFTSDAPDPALVEALTATWTQSGGNLPEVYRTLVTHPALIDSFRQKARQPFDFIATSLRGLGLRGADVMGWPPAKVNRFLVGPMARMGQGWGLPNGPNGWPEEAEAWITPQALAARINWALDVPSRVLTKLPDPRSLLDSALGSTRSEALAWAVPKAESRRDGVALILASNDLNRR